MILRLLILLALLAGCWLVWKRFAAPQNRVERRDDAFERMVRCDACGVHLPASEAVTDARNRQFCCEDHAGKQR